MEIINTYSAFEKVNHTSFNHKIHRIRKEEEFKIRHQAQFELLTKRELEIVKIISQGYNNQQTSDRLFISRHTVEQHRKNINRKLGINRVGQLFQYALAFDLI